MPSPEQKPNNLLPEYQVEPSQPVPSWIVNEATLTNEALDEGIIRHEDATYGLKTKPEIMNMMAGLVRVTHFVEFPPEAVPPEERGRQLLGLFQKPVDSAKDPDYALADYMRDNRQSVSLAMSTLDETTAEAIRYLNEKGVPVVAWVVLDDEDGYWTNRSNLRETVQRSEEVLRWVKENNLSIDGIGIDLEKPIDFIKAFASFNPVAALIQHRRYRAASKRRAAEEGDAKARLNLFIENLQENHGTRVETYSMPHPVKRLLGGLDTDVSNDRIEMLYTSDLPGFLRNGQVLRFMRSKGAKAALGLVSGVEGETPGRELKKGAIPNHLTAQELANTIRALLSRDLDFENRVTLDRLHIFALNDPSIAVMARTALRQPFATA